VTNYEFDEPVSPLLFFILPVKKMCENPALLKHTWEGVRTEP